MYRFKTLQSKILILFLSLLIFVELVLFALFASSYRKNAYLQMEKELSSGDRTFVTYLKNRASQLSFAASILSQDFAFKKAMATDERATISSALRNHGSRINADLMVLTDLEGIIISDTVRPESSGTKFNYIKSLAESAKQIDEIAIVEIENKAYQLVVVPLKAPLPVAWIILGFSVDIDLIHKFKEMTGIEVIFGKSKNGKWSTFSSSIGFNQLEPGIDALTDKQLVQFSTVNERSDYLGSQSTIVGENKVILLRNLADFSERWHALQMELLVVFLLSLIATIALGYLITRSVSKPVRALTKSALKIAEGNLQIEIIGEGHDEVGQLTEAFRTMTVKLKAQISDNHAASSKILKSNDEMRALNARLDRKLFETSIFLEIAQSGQTCSLDETLLFVFTRIMNHFGIDRASVMLVDEKTNFFNVQYVTMRSINNVVVSVVPDKKFQMLSHQGIAGQVFLKGQPLIVSNASKDSNFSTYQDWRDETIGAIVCLPIYRGEITVGVINLVQIQAISNINLQDLEFLLALSGQISKIFESVYHYEQSVTDGLTQLYNSKTFRMRLKNEIIETAKENKTFGLLLFDVDHFKKFNDTYGHLQGDRVLIDIAKAFSTVGRKSDVRARYGGEEFAMIISGATAEEALEVAEQLRKKIESWQYESLSGKIIKATISVGVALFPKNGTESQQLIQCADDALYAAKKAGRNNCQLSNVIAITPIAA